MEARSNLGLQQKKTFQMIFILAALMLVLLPFFTTLNELLTRVVEKLHLYMVVQNFIVPWEVKFIGALLYPLKLDFVAHQMGMTVEGRYIGLTWNCIGWQGMLLLFISFIAGFQGSYTRLSKLEAILIGVLGTFLINLFRMAFTTLLAAYYGQLFAILFHDYFATFVFIAWLLFFWWFVYGFVLETTS